jgi:hypothetical protein
VNEYKIEPGDTLGKIARKVYGDPSRFSLIVSANQISNPDELPVGGRLVIPDLEDRPVLRRPPYLGIADALKRGKVIPFLGAGVNLGVRPATSAWDGKTAALLPTGAELSRFLANKTSFPARDYHDWSDLAKVSSYHNPGGGAHARCSAE